MNEPIFRKSALITGSASGLGLALKEALQDQYRIFDYDLATGQDVRGPVTPEGMERLDLLINCAGINGIDWIPDVQPQTWDSLMDVNVRAPFFMAQHFLPLLKESRGTIVNVVSNASHMPMRCSSAYNASKGALAILTKQMARELSPDVTVFSISPNKLAGTGMSAQIDEEVVRTRGWTQEQAQQYQLSSLLPGEETPPELVAEFLAFLLSNKDRHKFLAGCDLPYGA